MKLKNILISMLVVLTCFGCSSTTNEKKAPINVLVPMGATSIATLGWEDNKNFVIDYVDGSDKISAELMKKDSKYDAIVAPINLGCKLASQGNKTFLLNSILTWGNLYLVGENELSQAKTMAAFGEGSVPQKVMQTTHKDLLEKLNVQYFATGNDVLAQLLTGKSDVALLAEPLLSMALAKGKEANKEFKILSDLQNEYIKVDANQSNGYPQAALFVKKEANERVNKEIKLIDNFIDETAGGNQKPLLEIIEKIGNDKLGTPPKELIASSWDRMNIKRVQASKSEKEIETFLKLFDIEFTADMIL